MRIDRYLPLLWVRFKDELERGRRNKGREKDKQEIQDKEMARERNDGKKVREG